jgi:hypothetical protein
VIDDPSADRKRLRMFHLLVTRDITLIILLLQAIIIGMAFFLQAADKNQNKIKHLYPASMSAFGVYYLSSLLLFVALLGLFGLIASCCELASSGGVNDRSNCACYSCLCLSPDCNGCDGGGDGVGILLIVIVLMFAIFGVFVGIILGGMIINQLIKRHTNKLWLRQETKKYIVKDFQGRSNELTNESTRHSTTNSLILVEIDNDRAHKTSSAPVQSLPLIAYNTQKVSCSVTETIQS